MVTDVQNTTPTTENNVSVLLANADIFERSAAAAAAAAVNVANI